LLLRTVPCIGRVVVLAAVSVRHTRTAARPERLPVGGILGPVRRTVPGTFWRAVPRRPGGTVAGALPVAGRCWARPWPLRLSRAAWTARSGRRRGSCAPGGRPPGSGTARPAPWSPACRRLFCAAPPGP
jgi:hypothetical protein